MHRSPARIPSSYFLIFRSFCSSLSLSTARARSFRFGRLGDGGWTLRSGTRSGVAACRSRRAARRSARGAGSVPARSRNAVASRPDRAEDRGCTRRARAPRRAARRCRTRRARRERRSRRRDAQGRARGDGPGGERRDLACPDRNRELYEVVMRAQSRGLVPRAQSPAARPPRRRAPRCPRPRERWPAVRPSRDRADAGRARRRGRARGPPGATRLPRAPAAAPRRSRPCFRAHPPRRAPRLDVHDLDVPLGAVDLRLPNPRHPARRRLRAKVRPPGRGAVDRGRRGIAHEDVKEVLRGVLDVAIRRDRHRRGQELRPVFVAAEIVDRHEDEARVVRVHVEVHRVVAPCSCSSPSRGRRR